jgi:hypothetical protein
MVITIVSTARSGDALNGGDARGLCGLGFPSATKLSRGRRKGGLGSSRELYTVPETSLVTISDDGRPPAREGRRARLRAGLQHTKRMRTSSSSVFSKRRGTGWHWAGVDGLVLGWVLGSAAGLLRPGKPLLLSFSVICFLFLFL